MIEEVILVDTEDNQLGVMEKMEAHRLGVLHRAFSVFIFNKKGDMLLQKRSPEKYHSPGLWTNACCSHPRPGESIEAAASRRLREELNFSVPIKKVFDFTYRAEFSNGLIEHEFDHVFFGEYDGWVNFNPTEVSDYCYMSLDEVKDSIQLSPNKFTEWFRIVLPQVEAIRSLKIEGGR